MRISDWSSDVCSSDLGLGDILVVARRTQERLQDVPISITAISAEKIESAQISQGSDLIRLVPTLNVQQSSTGPGQSYSLRGIRTGVITYFNEVPTPTNAVNRSEESRVGKECVGTCRSRRSPDHYIKNKTHHMIILEA